ncbi:bifunctional GNAT family N-acetyltransferase/carbon-nitrogen hydrolase family protein [Histidinibacterium lentulum]|uniref:GNAT family N-acetyltransferase n=1 Tax=Histidinibacterium lentulum TaxID=2480588 RepID=A0A3N2QYH5_9RHOB|nr:bifunctional GNAT family N-acetyltransferase/carbon-nitrogen hydrolase family protein [Histidinibacterium lentulum]ROU00249.1 GNAT family N-acetyltransferase [Histidinibacterium lentulum]
MDSPTDSQSLKPRLEIVAADTSHVDGIVALSARVYPEEPPYTRGQILGQIHGFPGGVFVALYAGEVVGYAASTLLAEQRVLAPHTWAEVTGGGYGSQFNARGDWLYGVEVMVDPARRRLRIGQRLYRARERLCLERGLKGIAFGARLPGWRRHRKSHDTPEAYLEAVRAGIRRDPVLAFQMKAGFEPARLLRDYAPDDRASGGHAALMLWRNPHVDEAAADQPLTRPDPETVRVASVQLRAATLSDPEQFYRNVDYFVTIASEYGADFVLFPEYFTLQLLSCDGVELPPRAAIERAATFTDEFVARLRQMALSKAINIVAGTHPVRRGDGIYNVAHVFLRDGAVHTRDKVHPTPDEVASFGILGGRDVDVIDTDCGPIGVAICYDAEFPELPRRLADEGARILFVPQNTDTVHGHLRVRYCAQARAIENQCYVVTSGMTGNLDNVSNIDIQYSQAAILTPCDFPFARDGIAAEASENVEMIIVADLNLASVRWARAQGSVRNLRDRRFDLYRTRWSDGG